MFQSAIVMMLIMILSLLPTTVQADDASLLGPQRTITPSSTVPGGVSESGVSSPQTGGTLQPAGATSSPLQPAGAGGSTISQSQAETLQAPENQHLQLLIQGEGDAPKKLENDVNVGWLGYALGVLIGASVITAMLLMAERYRLSRAKAG